MKPKRIILLRHGEALGNIDATAYSRLPDHQIHLTPNRTGINSILYVACEPFLGNP